MLRTFHIDYTIDSKGNSKYGKRSVTGSAQRSRNQSRPRSYIRLESLSKNGGGGAGKQSSSRATVSKDRQDSWEMQASAYATSSSRRGDDMELQEQQVQTTPHFGRADSQDELVPGRPRPDESGLVIQKTVDWSIQYEDDVSKAI